jgi:hypothetical protein
MAGCFWCADGITRRPDRLIIDSHTGACGNGRTTQSRIIVHYLQFTPSLFTQYYSHNESRIDFGQTRINIHGTQISLHNRDIV